MKSITLAETQAKVDKILLGSHEVFEGTNTKEEAWVMDKQGLDVAPWPNMGFIMRLLLLLLYYEASIIITVTFNIANFIIITISPVAI